MPNSKDNTDWPKGSIGYELFRWIMVRWFNLIGWKVIGSAPLTKRFVIIGAPHTSNWDFPLMLAIKLQWRMEVSWMGKDSLFRWPFGRLMRKLGGIAIDRSKSNNVVATMAETFQQKSTFVLLIPPEGTRAKVRYWKTGFYHIAHQSNVPIALGFLDYEKKIGGIGQLFEPTGDYEADMVEIKQFYKGIKGKHPS